MILGLCGSPRKKATDFVLNEALNMLKDAGFETEFFTVRGRDIRFCSHCDYCLKNHECIIRDDMDSLYPLIRGAKGIIVATPVYNGGVSAQIKTVMDRCRALAASDRDVFKHKVGMAIAVGGDRVGGQELAIQQIMTFYILNGVLPVGGGAFGANLGATFWSKDTLEGVMEDSEGFRSLRKTVKSFCGLLERLGPKGSECLGLTEGEVTVGKNSVKRRVAWGITGCGDRISETVEAMEKISGKYGTEADVRVYMSKAGEQVIKHYRLLDVLKASFGSVSVESDSNTPFLAGALQLGRFEFILIAPATSNTVAKISLGISDTLLSNSAIMALKAFVPLYIMPSDYEEGEVVTKRPDGSYLRLRVRKEDATNTKRLAEMDGVSVLKDIEEISRVFAKHFGK